MKALFNLIFLTGFALSALGQLMDTIPIELKEVTVTGYKTESVKFSPVNISSIKLDGTNTSNAFNLCDILKKTEGITMLTTGIGIAKPVIRGLYGNRVLVLLNGLKFDNQQWQEEHGLGLSSFGLSKVELIKGPIGILYGTEAIGGVINLIEEEKPKPNTHRTDVSLSFNSNTLGGMIQAGYIERKNNNWWRIRIGIDNNADYSDGKNQRILNSRFDGYYLKATYGFERKNWVSTNNYSASFNRFGFIFDDIYTFITPDNRWSRKLNINPGHFVLLNIFSSENRFNINSKLKLFANLGVQSNERLENEGGGAISLNMHLLTIQNLLKLEYTVNDRQRFIFSNLNSFENNTNYGARKIVPNANMQESNISVNYEYILNSKWIFENGIGFGEKKVKTYYTPSVNGQDKEVRPFSKFSGYYNLFSGISYNPNSSLNIKANLATGVRIANLAELSSDGLHEGVFTYEIGNPDLKNEQIYSANLFANYDSKVWGFSVSPFINFFNNYIYLTPVNEQWFGFPVYRYKQQDAFQFGTEISTFIKVGHNLDLKVSYSGMNSKTKDGNFTAFIPAQKITPQVNYMLIIDKEIKVQCYINIENYLTQNNTAPFEIKTPQYSIWNSGISTQSKDRRISLSIYGNNILNKAYTDHLSRFKNYGLLNIGRNFIVSIKYIL